MLGGMTHHDTPAVGFHDVVKRYGAVTALDHASFEIPRGQTVALLGPNGAGKSTSIDSLLGLRAIDAGTVRVLGTAPGTAVARGRVGAMLQTSGLPENAKVGEVVDLGRKLFGARRPLAELLDQAGLTEVAGQRASKLSGGQSRRVHFALALAGDPELLFLDEPTVGLDVEGRRDFWGSMRRIAERGTTILFATHYLEEADAAAERIIVLAGGQVRADDSPEIIKAHSAAKTIRCALVAPDADELRRLPGVTGVRVRGERVSVSTADADATVPALYATGRTVRDIEVTGVGLEEALIALTSDEEEVNTP